MYRYNEIVIKEYVTVKSTERNNGLHVLQDRRSIVIS